MVKWLKKRLIMYMATLFLFFLMLVMLILYLTIEDTLYDNAKESAYSIANSIYIALDETVFSSAQLITFVGHDPFMIQNFLENEDERQISQYLQNISNVYSEDFYIGSFSSHHYYSKTGITKTFNKNDSKDQWFFDLSISPSSPSGYHPIIQSNQGNIVLTNLQLIQDDSGLAKGFIIHNIDYTDSLSKIKDSVNALKASVYVVKSDGTHINLLLDSLNPSDNNAAQEAFQSLPLSTDSSNHFYQVVKSKTSITYKYIHEMDSYLVITQDLKTPIFYTFLVTLLIVIFVLACLLLVTLKLLDYSSNKIYQEASLDALTQIYNRSIFNAKLNEALELSRHYNIISSLIFVDIDNFKKINDELGHTKGDEMIQCVARLLDENKRKNDILFRWGGDEFGIIARSNLENTLQLAQRIHANSHAIHWKENTPISLSIGVTEIQKQDTKKLVFHRVDEALYEAKTKGKDQICSK